MNSVKESSGLNGNASTGGGSSTQNSPKSRTGKLALKVFKIFNNGYVGKRASDSTKRALQGRKVIVFASVNGGPPQLINAIQM